MLLISIIGLGSLAADLPADRLIRQLELVCAPAGEIIKEYRASTLYVEGLRELGLDVKLHPLPYSVEADYIWRERDRWDFTAWDMGARPSRTDPDDLLYNGFISTAIEGGYNFVSYVNSVIDVLLKAQRAETNMEKRREIIWEIQEIIAEDAPIVYTVAMPEFAAFRNDVFEPDSMVNMAGIGLLNYWTFVTAKPVGPQKTMIANYTKDIRALNPFFISGTRDTYVDLLIFDRVMRISPEGLPVPSAAQSVNWLDEVTLEVILRDNMTFHDGVSVTTSDVKFSYETAMSGEAPEYEPFTQDIESIEIVSDEKMIFHLKEPSAPFLTSTLCKLFIAPEHIWGPIVEELKASEAEDATTTQLDHPIGSGPFKFVAWSRGEEVVLEAFTSYYNAPAVERFVFRKVGIPEVALGQLQSGELNYLSIFRGDPTVLADAAAEDAALEFRSSITVGTRFFALNCRRQPFDDPAFRRAIAYAVPYDQILETIEQGFTVRADSYVSPALEYWHNPDIPQYNYDLGKARQILSEAGYEWDVQGRLYYPEGEVESLEPAWGP
jgi:peptide/nickel transport system substrate-binding protein